MCWYPVYSHPAGPSPVPWYRVAGTLVFRTAYHPCGESAAPSHRLVGTDAYVSDEPEAPSFLLRGSMLYPDLAGAHPAAPSQGPWYQAR